MEQCRKIDSAVTVTCWTDPTRFCWNRPPIPFKLAALEAQPDSSTKKTCWN